MKQLYIICDRWLNIKSSILYLSVLLVLCSSFRHFTVSKTGENKFFHKLSEGNLNKRFIHLTASLGNGSKVVLKFSRPEDIHVSHFVIQRSVDGTRFDDAAIIFVPENNIHSIRRYSYADKINSSEGDLLYYRLKIVDDNGKYEYSDVVIVPLETRDNQFAFADDFDGSDDYEYWCTLVTPQTGI